MNAKQYLKQIRTLDAKIQSMQKQVDELREMIDATGGTDYSRERVISSIPQDIMAARIAEVVDLETRIDMKIDELIWLKNDILKKIYQLDDYRYIRILDIRYVQLKDWKEVADELGYSERQTFRLHRQALTSLDKKWQ